MRRAGLILLCACNRVFGLERTDLAPPTALVDARFFDAPLDAPFACPAIGTVPGFAQIIHQQIVGGDCNHYNLDQAHVHGVADCGAVSAISQGPADVSLAAVPQFAPSGVDVYNSPRLAPEGDMLFVRHTTNGSNAQIYAYSRNSDDSWTTAYTVAQVAGIGFGVPSVATPKRHMMIHDSLSGMHEIVFDANGATSGSSYTAGQFGLVLLLSAPGLTPDGLRMLVAGDVTGANALVYADRPSINVPFTTGTNLADLSGIDDPFLTADCGRLYFSGVNSVLYFQRHDP